MSLLAYPGLPCRGLLWQAALEMIQLAGTDFDGTIFNGERTPPIPLEWFAWPRSGQGVPDHPTYLRLLGVYKPDAFLIIEYVTEAAVAETKHSVETQPHTIAHEQIK